MNEQSEPLKIIDGDEDKIPQVQDSKSYKEYIESMIDEFQRLRDSDAWNSEQSIVFLKETIKELIAKRDEAKVKKENVKNTRSEADSLNQSIWKLNNILFSCEISLLERTLSLNFNDIEFTTKSEEETKAKVNEANNFKLVLNNYLNDPAALTLQEIEDNLRNSYALLSRTHGLNNSARNALENLIYTEVVRRVEENLITTEQPEFSNIMIMFENNNKSYFEKLSQAAIQYQIGPKVEAFKKIYKALRDGQSGVFKTNFLSGKNNLDAYKLYDQIIAYSKSNPNSRTAKAWHLTINYYQQNWAEDLNLFTQIYKWSFKKSGIFKLSQIRSSFFSSSSLDRSLRSPLTQEEVQVGRQKENSRTARISNALKI